MKNYAITEGSGLVLRFEKSLVAPEIAAGEFFTELAFNISNWPMTDLPNKVLALVNGNLVWRCLIDQTDTTTTPGNLNIDALRRKKWIEIKAERARRTAGVFTVGAYTFDVNESALSGATLAAFMAQMIGGLTATNYRQSWVLADNTQVSLTATEMIAVGVGAKEYITGLWETSQILRQSILTATDAAALAAISWP